MTSSKDVHDMLGITADPTAQNRPKKKGKPIIKRPDGMAREIFSLLGERAPPIAIAEPAQYKAKRRVVSTENSRWRPTPFLVTSRNDGLLLKHWRKQLEDNAKALESAASAEPSAQAESTEESENIPAKVIASRNKALARQNQRVEEQQVPLEPSQEEYKFAKYDVLIRKPNYDDATYEAHLKSDTWSRDETDYLVELYSEYYGKWAVMMDRWEFMPSDNSEETKNGDLDSHVPRNRTMEEAKSRFYDISAKLMAANTPVTNMSTNEFSIHEKMAKFDPKQETERKKQKEAMLARTKGERDEERHLLAELERMYRRQELFETEVRDLRTRLDHSLTDDAPNTQLYQSSQEITGLFQKFIQRDKNNKLRRSLNDAAGASSSPTSAAAASNAPAGAGQPAGTKRSSLAHQSNVPDRRVLTPTAEVRFGVSTHDRLTSGVSFKSDRISKARQAKSQSKTEKIAILLGELGVPELVHMPTNAVCGAMEDLVKKILLLIDQRKVVEKEENDVRVARDFQALKAGTATQVDEKNQEKSQETTQEDTETAKTDEPEDDQEASVAEDKQEDNAAEEENDDAGNENTEVADDGVEAEKEMKEEPADAPDVEAEADTETSRPSTRGTHTRSHKRSASVLSAASSTGSGRSRAASKRLKAARG